MHRLLRPAEEVISALGAAEWFRQDKMDRLQEVYRYHAARLEALATGTRPATPFFLNGIAMMSGMGTAEPAVSPETDPTGWVRASLAWLAGQTEKACDRRVFRPLSMEHWFRGVHFVDEVLGATVKSTTQEGAGGWWAEHLALPIGTLRPPDLEHSATWKKAQALARAMAEVQAPGVFLAPQVLASPLNIAVNLYGEEFLVALIQEPDAARRDLRVIVDTILAMTRWFLKTLPADRYQPICVGGRFQPQGLGQICGCTTQLVGAEAYRQFIAPLDAEVLGAYPRGGGLIHLCGAHAQHIPVWRGMKELRAVQLNDRAAEDFELYFNGLRDDQVIYLNPSAVMTLEKALAISGGGRRLVLVAEPA